MCAIGDAGVVHYAYWTLYNTHWVKGHVFDSIPIVCWKKLNIYAMSFADV